MLRFLAGAAACFLLMTGAFLIWQSRAAEGPSVPNAPTPRAFSASMVSDGALQAPEASAKSREEKRFSRYDHNKDGKVEAAESGGAPKELRQARRRPQWGAVVPGICGEGDREVQRRRWQEGVAVGDRVCRNSAARA